MNKNFSERYPALIVLLLFSTITVFAAPGNLVKKISAKHFLGMESVGLNKHLACYKKKKEWKLYLLNGQLNETDSVQLDFNVKSFTSCNFYSNGSGYLVVFTKAGMSGTKDFNQLLFLSKDLQILKELRAEKSVASVEKSGDKGYYVVTNPKGSSKKNVIYFYDNSGSLQWFKKTEHGIKEQTLQRKHMRIGSLAPSFTPSNEMEVSANEDIFFWYSYRGRPGKPKRASISALNNKGELLFTKEFDFSNKEYYGAKVIKGKVLVFVGEKERLSLETYSYNGKLIDKRSIFNEGIADNNFLYAQQLIQQGENNILIGQGNSSIPVVVFDKNFKVASYKNAMGSKLPNYKDLSDQHSYLRFHQSQKHFALSAINKEDGALALVYLNSGVQVEVLYTGKRKSKVVAVANLINDDKKIKYSWAQVLSSNEGKVLVSFYSPNKKQLYFASINLFGN